MTEPVRRAGSHREVTPGEALAQRVWRPLLAVAVVVVTILLLIVINGHDRTTLTGAGIASPPISAPSGQGLPTAVPAHHRRTHPAPTSASPVGHRHPGRPVATAMAPVTVLNNSLRTGLAHQVAGQLDARGWPVGYVGNLRGRVAEVTAYYAPGKAAAARHLAAQFSSIRRVLPNQMLAGLHTQGVTLVLTRDWAG